MEFKKSCPGCKADMFYINKYKLKVAVNRNTKCKRCVSRITEISVESYERKYVSSLH